jgi:hypothetical protein
VFAPAPAPADARARSRSPRRASYRRRVRPAARRDVRRGAALRRAGPTDATPDVLARRLAVH